MQSMKMFSYVVTLLIYSSVSHIIIRSPSDLASQFNSKLYSNIHLHQ